MEKAKPVLTGAFEGATRTTVAPETAFSEPSGGSTGQSQSTLPTLGN